MSLIQRLRSVIAGDEYLDGDFDELDYGRGDEYPDNREPRDYGSGLASLAGLNPFEGKDRSSSNVIGMPGISSSASEVNLMEPRSFDEMPKAIQALRERKTVILNLTMMDPDQAQRAVDFVAGGTFAIDGHQERVGESIFLFAPSCVTVTNSFQEEPAPSNVTNQESENNVSESVTAPEPAWGSPIASAI